MRKAAQVKLKRKKMGADEKVYQTICFLFLTVVVVACIVPLLYVLSMSVTTKQEVINNNGQYVLFPKEMTFAAYEWLLQGEWVPKAMLVSVVRTLVGTFTALIITSMGAYVLSTKALPGRKYLILLVLIPILFAPGLIPSYLLIDAIGLQNSFWVYILPLMVDCWGMLVIKQFMEQLPDGLVEAAVIDGANPFRIYTRVVLPLSKPVLAAIGLFNAVSHWNSWFDAMLYMKNANLWPFQYVLRNILVSVTNMFDSSNPAAQSSYAMQLVSMTNSDSMKMAAVVIGTVPILLVYPFLQKHFAQGMLTGSVKG